MRGSLVTLFTFLAIPLSVSALPVCSESSPVHHEIRSHHRHHCQPAVAHSFEERDIQSLIERDNNLQARFFLFKLAKAAISGLSHLGHHKHKKHKKNKKKKRDYEIELMERSAEDELIAREIDDILYGRSFGDEDFLFE